jgi:membrane protein
MANRIERPVRAVDTWSQRWRLTRVIRNTIVGFFRHEALQYSGAMAYFAMLSLVNLFVLGVVAASFVMTDVAARDFVIERVSHAMPIDSTTVADLIDGAVAARGGVTIVGLALLLWSALGVFGALSRGISRVFVKAPPRPFWRDRLVGLALLVTTGFLVVASVALGIIAQTLQGFVASTVSLPGAGTIFAVLTNLIPVGLIFFAFLIVYRVLPNRPVETAEVWPGALVATVLWTALRVGFTFYATQVAKYNSVFGPIGTGITVLVFLYFSSVVLLLGAEVARANTLEIEARRRASRVRSVEPPDEGGDTPG